MKRETDAKRGRGRPRSPTARRRTLGSVRVTDEQVRRYEAAARERGRTRADWVRETLDRAAARVLGRPRD